MPDALTPSFLAALAALTGCPPGSEGRMGIAVSGGPDSMTLLHLAIMAAPGRVEAATVDHGLRPEAAAEAEMVARWCADRDIPHAVLKPSQPIEGSVQASARAVRYALLDTWMTARGLEWLLTAHHADDQLETMLMRLNRSSGVSGLAGVRARRGRVIRPLLGLRKTDLEAYAKRQDLPFVTDPSNADDRFDRARLRGFLTDAPWLDSVAAARSAAALADAEKALDWSVERLAAERVRQEGERYVLDQDGLPREYLRRLLAYMVRLAAPEAPEPRGERIDQAIIQLCHGKKISVGACVAMGGSEWIVYRAPPRRTG